MGEGKGMVWGRGSAHKTESDASRARARDGGRLLTDEEFRRSCEPPDTSRLWTLKVNGSSFTTDRDSVRGNLGGMMLEANRLADGFEIKFETDPPCTMAVSDFRFGSDESNGDASREEKHMRTILKYRVDVREAELKLPADSTVRHVAWEPGNPAHVVSLWVECPDVPTHDAAPDPEGCKFHERWEIAIVHTGQAITLDPGVGFLGTAIALDRLGNQLVWHVFGRARA